MKEPYKLVNVGGCKYKREHILVMEKILDHPIPKGMNVHHINGNTRDNRPENLQLMTIGEHRKLHTEIRRAKGEYRTPEEVAEAYRENARRYKRENPEKVKAASRRYYYSNIEKMRKKKHDYYYSHKEEISEYGKKYRDEHRDEITKKRREAYKKNAEERKEYSRMWNAKNVERMRANRKMYNKTHKEENARRQLEYRKEHSAEISARVKARRLARTPEQIRKEKEYMRNYYLAHKEKWSKKKSS